MSETGSDTRSGIGVRLRAGREKMGLTQLQTAEKLHVDPKVVENLEAERFDALGAPVFVRGHLKHYSELIGEKTGELLDLYGAASQPALPDLTRLPKAAPDSNPSRLAVPALVVLIGFVLLGVVWWFVKSVGGPEGAERPKRGPQPVAIAPDVSHDPAAVEAPASDGVSAAGGPGAATPAGTSGGAASSEEALNRRAARSAPAGAAAATGAGTVPAASPRAGTAAASGSLAPGVAPAAPATTAGAPATATPAATPPGKPMELTLRFAADSWVEVYDANGEKLFYDVGTAASSRTVSGTPPFRVHVANAPGVTLDVNGKPATVPANALKGDAAQFVINRSGRIVRARPQADGG
jgi:cytoskeleton protein RodZ